MINDRTGLAVAILDPEPDFRHLARRPLHTAG